MRVQRTDPSSGWVDPNPPDATDPRAERALAFAAVGLVVVVLLTLVGVVVAKRSGLFGVSGGNDRRSVSLTAANVATDDPFMPSVVVSPTAIADTVASDVASFTEQLPQSAGRGVRLVPGTQAGLYGGTGQDLLCDVPAVANYLDVHSEKSAEWAEALGVPAQKIPFYLNTLTPVVLTADTWVTGFRFAGGRAAPTQTVLQAGNAVLIDQVGVPRVHCASGDPLVPPANIDLASLEVDGKGWPEFNPHNVIAAAYAGRESSEPIVEEFRLRDIASGETVTRQAGGTIAIGDDPAGWKPDPVAMNVPPTAGVN